MGPDGRLHSTWNLVHGLRMHARVATAAPAGAPPVVLVHGLGVSGTYLLPTARCLAPQHPVYVPDLPGFGKSDRPPAVLGIRGLADALAAWQRTAGPPRAVFVGNSLGCQTIVDFALRYPEQLTHAVLIGATLDPSARSMVRQVGRGVLDLFFEPLSFWPVLLRDYLTAGTVRSALTLRDALRDPLEEKLKRMPVPTLVLRGEHDPIAPQAWAERMAELLPVSRLEVIPGAAHVANYSHPELVAAAVRTFIRSDRPSHPDGASRRPALPNSRPPGARSSPS